MSDVMFSPSQTFNFGEMIFTEEAIIDFAKRYDPLPFHTDVELAKQSPFKQLVASGPHIFNAYYLRNWVPLFGHTVFAGRGVQNWEMLLPVYANQPYFCNVEILAVTPKPEKRYQAVDWDFHFTNPKNETVQRLMLTVMHHLR